MTFLLRVTACMLGCCLLLKSNAQEPQRYTESEVMLEQQFIEANRERILGNYAKAQELFQELYRKAPANAAVAYELARIYDKEESNEEALKYAKKAVELEPSNTWYQRLLADLHQKEGNYGEAAMVYEKLVERFPSDEYYYDKWAYFLVRANQPDKAIEVYDALEGKVGINEELSRRKHSLYLGLGNQKKAEEELLALIQAFPDRTEYRHILAEFYLQANEEAKAKAEYERILALHPNDGRAQIALAQTDGNGREELLYLRSLKAVFVKSDLEIDLKINQLLPFIEQVAETADPALADAALELSTLLEDLHPDNAKGFAISGDLYFYSNRPKLAVEKYQQTRELDPSVYLVWEHLLYALLDIRDYEEMARSAEQALDLYPNQATLYYFYALALGRTGHPQDAIASIQQANLMVRSNPEMQAALQALLAEQHYTLEQIEKAEAAFNKAQEIIPGYPPALQQYSLLLAEREERLEDAKNLIETALKKNPNNASYLATLGRVHYRMKNFEKAIEQFEKALTNGGNYLPQVLEFYGDALFQKGQEAEALKYWQEALEHGIATPLLEKKIANKQLYE